MAITRPTEGVIEDKELFDAAATPETPKVETPTEPPPAEAKSEVPPEAAPVEPPPPKAEDMIPSWRLREEAEGRRAAQEIARKLQDRLEQIEAHLRQAAGEEEKPPNFFEDPDVAISAHIRKAIEPVLQNFNRQLALMSKNMTETTHGKDVVKAAETAFYQGFENKTLTQAEYDEVVNNPNRWGALVDWHNRKTLLATVGSDPNAWFERRLAEKMSGDPQFLPTLLERARKGAASPPTTQVRLPPSLSDAPSARRERQGNSGMPSDADLFSFATQK